MLWYSFYIPSEFLPNFLILSFRQNCILACCVITEIDERMEWVKWRVSEPFNQYESTFGSVVFCSLGMMFPTFSDIHLAPFSDEQLYMEHYSRANFW